MGEAVFSKREWISAQASYATQAAKLVAMVDRLADQLRCLAPQKNQRIAVVGIGASHAAAATAVYEMRRHGLDALRFLPSELPAGLSGFQGLTVLISQSGRSAEVVALARNGVDAGTVALTNYTPSPLGTICRRELNLGNLPDSSVSFVSFTGTMLALALLIDHLTGRDRTAYWKQLIAEAFETAERHDDDIRRIAEMLLHAASIDVVAPASLGSVAEESALMFREGPRLFATAMETRQYLHGPMDAAGPGAHLLFGGRREAQLVSQLSERTRRLALVTAEDTGDCGGCTHKLVLPVNLDDPSSFAIASTFVAQRLTLHAADIRGLDINEPAFQRIDTKTDTLTNT
ncbi:SIS domain-containing protein [Rhizobium puerariae]|uniref:Glutamine--fructose-6-phosphate aminotransferase [isomerizing] n=1 Tax=Rhizobium puerariae TaxID=1585791 RepID=A0ABV6ACW6_9HYPH